MLTTPPAVVPMGLVPAFHAARMPSRIAVQQDGEELHWGDFADATARSAQALVRAGVRPDDLVALDLPNGSSFFVALFAIWQAGATPLPLSPRLAPAERADIMALASPRLVIGSDWQVPAACPSVPVLAPPARCWKAMPSGGSTGRPKLIVSDRPAVTDPTAYTLFPWQRHHGRLGEPGGVMLNSGPLSHNGPFVHTLMNLLAGSTIVSMARFDAQRALDLIGATGVSFAYLVPTMMRRIWDLGEAARAAADLSSLRGIIHTAAPCPADLKRAWIGWLGPDRVWEAYGTTEAVAATLIDGAEWLAHPGSVGRCIFNARLSIRDAAGAELPPGAVGDVWVKADAALEPVFHYYGTSATSHDGWWHFGDLGHVDADGWLWIADRRTDLIVRGGVNIYPAEVEAALEALPGIDSAAVIGLPDADLGARVHAMAQAGSSPTPTLADIHAGLAGRLSRHKWPESIDWVNTPLRDAAGKVRRGALRNAKIAGAENKG
jgi:bile acid-coenzyme A ligase